MRHTDEDIERAAQRFEELVGKLDPAAVQADDLGDLRAVAKAAEAAHSRRGSLAGGGRGGTCRGRSWNHIAVALGVSAKPPVNASPAPD